ncbi:MAG TPA: response regulator [Candidatus Acidoferrales bacterium]|jgi:PAS domain S-box-containing protein|nr:response regulator [Candidatus Acidoferrales bacterium]
MTSTDLIIVGSYDYRLVVLSILIAILASYAALDLSSRVTSAQGRARLFWFGGGATAMGIGIWAMHYIGMLAFKLPVPVQYDWPTVLLSLLAAIVASAIALFVVSRRTMGLFRASAGSIFMGGGIAAMHYIGMEAMRLPAMCRYSSFLVTVSVAVAIVISFVALLLTFHFRGDTTSGSWLKTMSALVMGAAIPVMHYTGMAAASFVPSSSVRQDLSHSISISFLGVASIAIVTLIVLSIALVTSLVDRRFSLQGMQLESSEKRYRQIVESALDAFIGTDSNGTIKDWNTQAEAIFGWSHSEAVGQNIYQTIVPNRLQTEEQRLAVELLAQDGASVVKKRLETSGLHRDGHEIPLELSISVIRDDGTKRFGVFVRDITEQKRSEQELIAAKEAAEAGSRSKSEFLANMSHEIRTPLNGVIGMTELTLGTELTSAQRAYLEMVKLSADSLLGVINDILDFSKIEAGKIDLDSEDFNLRDSLEGTLKTLALRADEKGLELLCEIAPSVPEIVRGDSNRLRQVVINLLGNAIKFTSEGEVVLNVVVEAEDGDDRILHFRISDSGIGIPIEKHEAIFQPFTQADSSTTRKYGGTGLGLTISKRLVGLMCGKIWLESEVGRGTKFHFTARLKASSNSMEMETIAQLAGLKGVKVLVVDDNRTNRRILNGMLERWEMNPTSVEHGEAALVQLISAQQEEIPYGLILTDMQMPKMDGFNLVERIRQRPELSTATIMMLNSAGHLGDAARCQELGVAAYLLKPIRQSELREAIARVLGAREQKNAIPLVTSLGKRGSGEQGTSLRVLLAEDNAVNQRLAVRLLEKRGHSVVVAANGREALEVLERDSFDLVLMDLQMPEMDGFKTTAVLREKEKIKNDGVHQHVVALTAHAMKGDRERCQVAGMDAYLAKPIRIQELDEILEIYIARRISSVKTYH